MDAITGSVLIIFIIVTATLVNDLKIKRTNSKGETTEISFKEKSKFLVATYYFNY